MTNDELVNVMVPRKHLSSVYGLIAQLDSSIAVAPGVRPEPLPVALEDTNQEWTPARLRKMVEQCPPAMKRLLRALASRAGEWVSSAELVAALGKDAKGRVADSNTLAGTLGAFGRRVGSRYGLESWPFEDKYDHAAHGRTYRMTREVAAPVLRHLDDQA